MNKKLIIFDKDGTLLDFDAYWIPVSVAALSDITKSAGLDSGVVSEILDAFCVKNGATAITSSLCCGTYDDMGRDIFKVLSSYNSKLSEEEVKKLTRELYHKHIDKGEIKPTSKKLSETLEKLKNDGFILGVVTTDSPLVTDECLKALGIKEFFSFVISDDGVMPAKPNPESIDFLCEKYSLSKNDILMVGDTLTDVSYAKAGGIEVFGLAKTKTNAEILKANGADFVESDVEKIYIALN